MPDGDVFGEKMDGTWREAAALVEQGADIQSIEEAAIKALGLWVQKWLPNGINSVTPFLEILLQYDMGRDSAVQRAHVCQSLDRLGLESHGNKIIAAAAKSLLATPQTWYGLTGFLEQRLYHGTIREAIRRGFIEPVVTGAAKQGIWSSTETQAWHSRLEGAVDHMINRLGSKVPSQVKQPRPKTTAQSKQGTADLLNESLPTGGATWRDSRSGRR
jgi:hypothetical protein